MVRPEPWTDPDGRVWEVYMIEFDSPDGKFTFDIMAISWDHAQLQVDAIRETAKLGGRVAGYI